MNDVANAEAIFRAAVDRVDPARMIERAVRIESGELVVSSGAEELRYGLGGIDRIFVTGMGKASAKMAAGLERALGDRISGGL
ncbi:MAG TPA: DUF4147 domain-containing protein, partial [Spirochaetia bacterium]|nr:DUF4147 domain-containing protein [Spirochaetia bacterium]